MKALIQRVSRARVEVGGETVSEIGRGFLVLLGVMAGDGDGDVSFLSRKVAALRIFEDDGGKMNLSVVDIRGEVLVISQFTLAADTRKGNRPSFARAEEQQRARALYERFIEALASEGLVVRGGRFGARMDVSLVNSGPVTILIDSREARA